MREAIYTLALFATRIRQVNRLACTALVAFSYAMVGNVTGADVPPGFAETTIAGPWSDAVGITFEDNGRM